MIFVSELPLMMLLDGREPGKTHAWYMFANDDSYSYYICPLHNDIPLSQ